MNAISGVVSHAPVIGVRVPCAPQAVELPRVEDDLVHDLGDLDRVRGRAGAAALKRAARWIGDVGLVVWGVGVLAVPA